MLPIVDLDQASAPLFHSRHGTVSRARFVSDVEQLASRLPAERPVLNLCENRYASCAAMIAAARYGQLSLLPPDLSETSLQGIDRQFPSALRLSDNPQHAPDLLVPAIPEPGETAAETPFTIRDEQDVAVVFTSGSTGTPQAQLKQWRSLHTAGRLLSQRLLGTIGPVQILATVPAQHMYGLEAGTMLALAGGHSVHVGRPMFPEDIRAALAALEAPRMLVTTPLHLRALLQSGIQLPPLAIVLSATAPLPHDLAARAEQRYGAPIMELYGCSEAGSIATRRTVEGGAWQLLDGMRLSQHDERSLISAAHLPQSVELQDIVRPVDEHRFHLVGRTRDLVKVAGKRASLTDLTQKLLSIPGVVDAIVFLPDAQDETEVLLRLAAIVVAPHLSPRQILAALGRMIDPVFLPRPLLKVDNMPRNGVGKLPRSALLRLLTNV